MHIFDELISAVGSDVISRDPAKRNDHSGDKWFAAHLPDLVAEPHNPQQVAVILAIANRHEIPVTPRGSWLRLCRRLCTRREGGIALSLIRMNRIKELSIPDGVAVVEPGVITGQLQAAARDAGMFYPPDPASFRNSSIGGNIATNAGGPRCLKYGVTRHYVLGLEVVLADGTIVRVGGRTMKNKTGFDLVGLFVGSEGMLGIVTEATIRLIPLPPSRASISASFREIEDAAEAVQQILKAGFLPSALEIADRFTLESARKHLGHQIVPDRQRAPAGGFGWTRKISSKRVGRS